MDSSDTYGIVWKNRKKDIMGMEARSNTPRFIETEKFIYGEP